VLATNTSDILPEGFATEELGDGQISFEVVK